MGGSVREYLVRAKGPVLGAHQKNDEHDALAMEASQLLNRHFGRHPLEAIVLAMGS